MRREVLPFAFILCLLVACAALADAALHYFQLVWVGRYLGIPGTLLIIGSFGYSLRKRKKIGIGSPAGWLRWHELMAWLGSLLVLIHAGIHFNAILGWLAVAAMLVNVASGLTGKFLIDRSRRRLEEARSHMREQGIPAQVLEDRTYWDSLTFDAVTRWRKVHFPITLAFGVLALAHIISIFLYWGWK
ncbi:MAG: hypothetical protein WCP99_19600 [Burkholderiales bacterium]